MAQAAVALERIPIYVGTPSASSDPRTHFWYRDENGKTRRLCDSGPWPHGKHPRFDDSLVYLPCAECRSLYVDDLVEGSSRFDPQPYLYPYPDSVVDSPQNGYLKPENGEGAMDMNPIAVTTFASYYEAAEGQRLRIINNLLTSGRDYYWALRNTLAETHWLSDDIATFEEALPGLLRSIKSPVQYNHYVKLADGYVAFWKKRPSAHVFRVPNVYTEVAGLPLRVSSEIGIAYQGDEMPLKLYLRATRPTRKFREAIQHITDKASAGEWDPNWQAAILDVRREDRLPRVNLPANFEITIEAQAMAFMHAYERLRLQRLQKEQ